MLTLTFVQGDDRHRDNNGSPRVESEDLLSKIQSLEIELAEALEANEMYKAQLKK